MARFERWLEVKQIFEESLEVAPEAQAAFLDRACRGDDDLRREVEALLSAPAVPTSSLAGLLGLPERREEPDYGEGDTINHFVIVRCVGRGGMGTVYEARDTKNDNRSVALKVLFSRTARFSQDKRLARFSDSRIVTFHDSGETSEGLPYFVFEYVDGEPITTFCERRSLGLHDRLRLFIQVCAAVRYAHQRLVIHCDLKPENILITPTGDLKLLDFGIARTVGAEDASISGYPTPITLPFASPEQVGNELATTLSDVYSLGVVLCVLMTGRLPYRGVRNMDDLREAVRHQMPARPSELVLQSEDMPSEQESLPFSAPPRDMSPALLASRLRGDLDAAVLKALHKDPQQRYQSAEDFSEDIRRYLNHEPLRVLQRSRRYRAAKFLRRHRPWVIAAAVAFFILSGLVGALFLKQRQAVRERDQARQESLRARELTSFLQELFLFYDPELKPGDATTVRGLLDRASAQLSYTLRSQPATQVRLLNTLGQVYQDLTLYDDAERCFQTALRLARKERASDDPLIADSLLWLGVLRRDQGHYDESLALLKKSLGLRERRVPETDPDRTFTITQIGGTLWSQGAHAQAERRLREALRLQRVVAPPDQKAIARTKSFLVGLLIEMHRFREAEPLVQEVLAARERLYGPKHPLVATTLQDLAVVLQSTNRADEAEKVQRQLVAIFEELFGSRSQRTIVAKVNLGSFLMVEGRITEAIPTLRGVIGEAESVFGPRHPDTIMTKVQLARALIKARAFPEAEEILNEAQDVASRTLGADHFIVGLVSKVQGQCAFAKGAYRTAEAHFRKAIEILRGIQGDTSYGVLTARAEWASTLAALGRPGEAEPLLIEYHRRAEGTDVVEAIKKLVSLYESWGKPEKAADYRRLLLQKPNPAAP